MTSARLRRAANRVADGFVARTRPPFPQVARFEDVAGAVVRDAGLTADFADRPGVTLGARVAELDSPYPTPEHRILTAELTGAHLLSDGAVVTDGRLVRESLWDVEHWERSYARAVRLPKAVRVEGEVASLLSLWADNHYHWVMDVLPRLATLEAAGLGDLPLLVPARLGRAKQDSLDLLGLEPSRLVPSLGHVVPDRLIWASSPSYVMHTTTTTAAWLRTRLTARLPAPERPRRLYVQRTASRRVANETEVLAVLEPHGFEVLVAEQLSFPEQVAAFAAAEAVVAPHGAGLVGLAFGTGAEVLELFGRDYTNPCFRVLAAAAGHHHRYLVGPPSGPAARQGADFTVDLALLRASLEEMFASSGPSVRATGEPVSGR